MATNSEITKAVVRAVKADFVKRAITVQLEASLDDFAPEDRDALAQWAEMGQMLRVTFSTRTRPTPLLDQNYGDGA